MNNYTNLSFAHSVVSTGVTTPSLGFFDVSASSRFVWTLGSLLAIVAFFLTTSFKNALADQYGNTIPKGPTGFPILGSFPFLTRYPELTLDCWAKKFGSLYSVWLGNQLFVIISDPAIAKDLLVTNGSIFSSRKEMYVKSQTVFAGRGITATPYNDRWLDSYTGILDREVTSLIKALFVASDSGKTPVNPQPHAGRCSLNNMTTITFGFRTDGIDHPLVKRALKLSREFIPMLIRGKRLHQDLVDTYGGFVKEIESKVKRGEPVNDCLAKTLAEVRDEEELDDLDMAIMASAFLIGGVETTAAIMQWFSALIPAYPEIQKKAQEELDRVVGRSRLPTVEDEKNLPYCHAIIKEVERVHNPFWLGTPHVASEDFTYNGRYFIPKDTVVVLNTWTMHHDPERHVDPYIFNPDRYIDDNLTSAESANLSEPYKRDHWMFGAGRRICPGMIVAEREIWLTVSRMLWAFDMTEIPGEPIDLKEYDGLSGRSPVPFRIKLTPRDKNVAKILKNVSV
ncbi:hypothetical protein ABKA04_005146 [Annulohypoxylon sp. FPYF3050]